MTDFRAHPSEEPSFHRGRGSTGRLKIEKGPLGLYQLCVAAQPSHIFSSTAAKRDIANFRDLSPSGVAN